MIFCEAVPCRRENDLLFDGFEYVHLISDRGVNELAVYGRKLGLPSYWISVNPVPHFNLSGESLKAVFGDSRVEKLDRAKFVERVNAMRGKAADQNERDHR